MAPMTPSAQGASEIRIATGSILLLVGLLFGQVVLTERFLPWDASEQYWADLQYLCGALADGEWPRWNPYDRGGYPLLGDPQAGLYYPLNWLLCALGGASPTLTWSEVRVALHTLVAGLGMLAYLRAIELRAPAALAGAIVFMLAPFERRMWGINLTYRLAYLRSRGRGSCVLLAGVP
jgi:hypothetical protein